ncbi:MAG: BamA/TamA family outer membrane protein [Rhodobacteraceae bacterium]|nr:BamA/TamA family outer membrane protein [Paracoccaceae bacterium]
MPNISQRTLPNYLTGMFLAASVLLALAVFSAPAVQAAPNLIEHQSEALEKANSAPDYGIRTGSVVVAPIPFNTPTIGAGLALGAAYLFSSDEHSNASIIGFGGFRSDNGSMGYGLTVNLAWHNNRWIFKSFLGDADLKYDIYFQNLAVPIRQQGTLARMSLAYGVTSKLSFGATVRYLNTNVSLANQSAIVPPPIARDANLELLTLGVIANWDLRDDTIYPKSGLLLNFEAFHGINLDGPKLGYSKAFVNFSHFLSLGKSGVLATRLSTCTATEDTPFFDMCSLGGTDNMRGFSATEFLDQRLVSAQIEYRHELTGRIGAVVFAGAGMTGSEFSTLHEDGVHSAAGLGLRIRISRKFPVDFSIDGSLNNDNQKLLYIYVGQRF